MTSTAKEPGTRGRPEKVRAAAIRRATLAGLAVILVSAGPEVAMAAPRSPEPDNDRPPGPTIVQVNGRQFPVDAEQGMYSMLGDLIGRWTIRGARGLAGYSIPEAPGPGCRPARSGSSDASTGTTASGATRASPRVRSASTTCSGCNTIRTLAG
jgi:hypothetical protein